MHDPTDPVGRLLFNVLAMVAEFEADLISMRTREGMKVAKAKGHLRGKQPKLTAAGWHLLERRDTGNYSTQPRSPDCQRQPVHDPPDDASGPAGTAGRRMALRRTSYRDNADPIVIGKQSTTGGGPFPFGLPCVLKDCRATTHGPTAGAESRVVVDEDVTV